MWRRGNNGDPFGLSQGFKMFFKFGDVVGSCNSPQYEGWIDLLAWSWGMAKDVSAPSKPITVRDRLSQKKKAILKAAGIPEEDDDDDEGPQDAPPRTAPRGRRHARQRRAPPASSLDVPRSDRIAAALAAADYDSDNDDDNKFADSEVVPVKIGRSFVQDLSVTKYVDLSSAQLMLSALAAKKGVEATLRICKEKVTEIPEVDEKEEGEGKEAKDDSNLVVQTHGVKSLDNTESSTASSSSSSSSSEPAKKAIKSKVTEYLVFIELVLSDAFVTSVSTGGSGGEDRLTENISIQFGSFSYRYNGTFDFYRMKAREQEEGDDQKQAADAAAAKAKEKLLSDVMPSDSSIRSGSLIFDPVRNRGQKLDEFVEGQLKMRDELKDVRGLVMGYL